MGVVKLIDNGEAKVESDRCSCSVAGTEGGAHIRGVQLAGHCENTLWAFAKTGAKPGEWMMEQLERRMEVMSGEFNSQTIANTLWAFATMGTKPGSG